MYLAKEGNEMKKGICMLLSSVFLLCSVPVWGAEITTQTHTFTAQVGTTNFTKNGVAQPLDVAIYLKDGYVMLPMRTFFSAISEDAIIHWDAESGIGTGMLGAHVVTFDVTKNQIQHNGKNIAVSGQMEVKEGRLFVPLRNWGAILQSCGYQIEENAITWDSNTKQAKLQLIEYGIQPNRNLEKLTLSGEGAAPVYTLAPTQAYDAIENIGDGLFLAAKSPYPYENDGVLLGGSENTYFILDQTGQPILTLEAGSVFHISYLGEGCFFVIDADQNTKSVIDKNGNTLFALPYEEIEPFSEGLARVQGLVDGKRKYGYVDTTGKLCIPLQFDQAEPFSEGLAKVRMGIEERKYGFIDKSGTFVIPLTDTIYMDFSEGLAEVRTETGRGYINQSGEIVIPPQYTWSTPFVDGTAFVCENDTIWLLDTDGKKIKQIGQCENVIAMVQNKNKDMLQMEQSIALPNGNKANINMWYDKTGEISQEVYEMKEDMAEGLAPVFDDTTKKYGYVDESGKRVIASVFDSASTFLDGYAVVNQKVTLADGTEDKAWGIVCNPNTQ